MLNVSTFYNEAKRARRIKSTLVGVLTLANGTKINLTENIILKDSLSFTNRCTEIGEFSIGSCFVGEMTVELLLDSHRYSLKDARIRISQMFLLPTGIYEEIPLGFYRVDEVTRTKRTVYLRCYDDMLKFDKLVDYSGNGFAYDLYAYICKKCDVVLGNTKEEIEALPNSEKLLYLSSDNVKTYREALSYIARLQVAFCTIGRDGKLYIKSLEDMPAVDTIEADRRVSSTIYDYETYFVRVRARFIANTNFYPYEAGEGYEGITVDLGDIPILYGLDEVKHDAMSQIWDKVKNIRYNPCAVSMVGDASLEVGDYVIIEDANGSEDDIKALITSITWVNHGQMEVSSDGKDANLENIQTQTERDISNMQTAIGGESFSMIAFTNINRVEASSDYSILGNVTFVPRKEGLIVFNGVAKITAEEVCKVRIKYAINGVEMDFIHVCQVPRGEHTLTLFLPLPTVEGQSNTLYVYISSTENVIIESSEFKGSVYGAGLVSAEWDGTIEVSDRFSLKSHKNNSIAYIDDDVSASFIVPNTSSFEDVFSLKSKSKLKLGYSEEMRMTLTEPEFLLVTNDDDYIVTNDDDYIRT